MLEKNERQRIKRHFNALYSPNDSDLLYFFFDFHRQLYSKTRLVMQAVVGGGIMKYFLSLFYNTNKRHSFKFMDEILYINLASEYYEDYDIYDIGFTHTYSKCILKTALFEDVFAELIVFAWNPSRVFDWCFDEDMKVLLGGDS